MGFGGLQGGFGREVGGGQYYVGVVGWGDWGTASDTNNQNNSFSASVFFPANLLPPIIRRPTEVDVTANANVSTTVKITDEAGVAAKLGWIVAPRRMIMEKSVLIGQGLKSLIVSMQAILLPLLDLSNPNSLSETIASVLYSVSGIFQQF